MEGQTVLCVALMCRIPVLTGLFFVCLQTMESTDSEIYSGTESETELESGDLNGTISPTSSSSTPVTTDTKPAPLPTTKVPTNMDRKVNS